MRKLSFVKPFMTLYVALVVVIPFSEALRSLCHLWISSEYESMELADSPLLFAARLEADLEPDHYKEIGDRIQAIDGIASAQFEEAPIPEWDGEPEDKEQWESMWKASLTPILYATSELVLNEPGRIEEIAGQIGKVSGVQEVQWDSEGIFSLSEKTKRLERLRSFFNGFFFIYIVAVIAGLLAGFPLPLRRQYAIRFGAGGAGSQVNPEGIWLRSVILHVLTSTAGYAVVFSLSYLFFPLKVQAQGVPDFTSLLLQGAIATGGLTGAIVLIGWWLKADDMDMAAPPIPPVAP
ncbi:MAG: hypothetical protein AB1656_06280 [Candidatus Omnitrophota bacterium]